MMHSIAHGRCHVVRWFNPTLADVQQVALEVRNAAASAKSKLICMAIIDQHTTAPESKMLGSFNMGAILRHSDHVHFVVLSEGFKASIHRSLLLPFRMMGRKGGNPPVDVHDSLRAALANYPQDVDLASLLDAGAKRDVFLPEEVASCRGLTAARKIIGRLLCPISLRLLTLTTEVD